MKKIKKQSATSCQLVKAIVCVSLILNFYSASAQDTNKMSVKLYGFVRNYLTFDSRKTYTVIGGEYNMQPYDVDMHDGLDLNADPTLRLQALTSRFGVALTGPTVWGWASSGKLEGDFGGFGNNNTILRLRLAYLKLNKDGGEILVGQDWHPLSGDIMPEVLGMAAGAPFRAHSRTPQVRTSHYWGAFGYTGALLWQLQYMNNGPKSAYDASSVASIDFAHKALLPEAFLGFDFRQGAWYAQLGVDAQILRPRTHAEIDGVVKKVDETVTSFTPTLYFNFQSSIFNLQFRTLLAQNTSHLNQLVGYAVTGLNEDGSWSYVPLRASISYLNIAYGSKVRANLFLGYMKNLGAGETLHDFGTGNYRIYMKGGEEFTHLNSLYRIAPSVSYNVKAFNLGLEYEWTACTYGDLAADGSILLNDNLHQVANHRVCALVKYNF